MSSCGSLLSIGEGALGESSILLHVIVVDELTHNALKFRSLRLTPTSTSTVAFTVVCFEIS